MVRSLIALYLIMIIFFHVLKTCYKSMSYSPYQHLTELHVKRCAFFFFCARAQENYYKNTNCKNEFRTNLENQKRDVEILFIYFSKGTDHPCTFTIQAMHIRMYKHVRQNFMTVTIHLMNPTLLIVRLRILKRSPVRFITYSFYRNRPSSFEHGHFQV